MQRFRNTGIGKSEFSRKAGKMKQTTEERNPTDRLLHGNWNLLHAARKGGIGAIIDAAGEIFDCPVIFVDTDFRLRSCCNRFQNAPAVCVLEPVTAGALSGCAANDADFK